MQLQIRVTLRLNKLAARAAVRPQCSTSRAATCACRKLRLIFQGLVPAECNNVTCLSSSATRPAEDRPLCY